MDVSLDALMVGNSTRHNATEELIVSLVHVLYKIVQKHDSVGCVILFKPFKKFDCKLVKVKLIPRNVLLSLLALVTSIKHQNHVIHNSY
jgi:hypothetical protein